MISSSQDPSVQQYLPFFSHARYLMILLVLVLHACFGYTHIFPGWFVKDTASHRIFDIIMLVSDLFVLPVLFFIAGFFTGFLQAFYILYQGYYTLYILTNKRERNKESFWRFL